MDRRRLLRVTHMVSTSEMLRRCRNSVPVIPVNGMRRLPASSQIILEYAVLLLSVMGPKKAVP